MKSPSPRKRFKPAISLILSVAVASAALTAVLFTSGSASAQSGRRLSKHDRELLATARANGEKTVTLLIAARPGYNRTVAAGIQKLGGTVRYRDDDLSYIRAVVPIDKAEAAAALSGVERLELNEVIPIEDPRPDQGGDAPEGATPPTPQTPPGAGTPNNNPYMPTGDTGASQFVAANPAWDGRDVKIGIIDSGVTLDHPSLLTTSTGERKIVDWVTATDPFIDGDPTWVVMSDQVTAAGGGFSYENVQYTAPADGTYRIGLFNERDPRLGVRWGTTSTATGTPRAAAASSPSCGTPSATTSTSTPTRTTASPTSRR